MTIVYLTAIFFAAAVYLYQRAGRIPFAGNSKRNIAVLLLAALVLRAVLAVLNQGFPTDIACFYGWADKAYKGGLSSFYASEGFTDYPPGYIFILYILGFFQSVWKLPYLSGASLLLLKLPAILCDLMTGALIYKTAKEKLTESRALMISALYLLNPAVILNSCVWGQIDAVMCFMLLLMCCLLRKKKMILSYVTYAAGVLFKPQMLIFTPVLLWGIAENVLLHDFDRRRFFKNLFGGLAVILGMVLVCVPFGLSYVWELYTGTLGSYPYVTVNAYNFWALIGRNWGPQEEKLLFLSCESWGTLAIFINVALSAVIFFKAKAKESRYFLTAASLILFMFLFSVRMHERYLFPAMALLLLAYAVRPLKGILYTYAAITLLQLYNTADVLFIYSIEGYTSSTVLMRLVSAGMLLTGFYFYRTLYRQARKLTEGEENQVLLETGTLPFPKQMADIPKVSEKRLPFNKKDAVIILTVMLIYGAVAFFDLGESKAPQTAYRMKNGEMLTLEIPKEREAAELYWYLGSIANREFLLEYKTSANEQWQRTGENGELIMRDVFKWAYAELPPDCRYLRLTCRCDEAYIMELAFADADGKSFLPQNASAYQTLFDEHVCFPSEGITFRNGTYFDEIYHARTGYEFLHGLMTYETTHPPFGKLLISLGIAIFGMTPFGWRCVGTLIGVLMLPVIYLLARDISKSRWLGGFACILMAADFMHFTQTRIATIDVYVTFFILLMYYFMYQYAQMSFYDTPLKKTWIPLGACGVTMGFAIASKWTGVYGAAGLAVIFFAVLYRRYREYLYAKANPSGTSSGIRHKDILCTFGPYTVKTIEFCLIFFVAVPALIYILSYIPFKSWDEGLLNKMWRNQMGMLSYHSGLEATHPFSSAWYEWPTMIRPILYYSQAIGETARSSISAFGNPLVWWAGIPAFVYMLYLTLRKRDCRAAFISVGYLAEYLPWCLVPRIAFIYHYFPSVPFVVLMLMYAARQLRDILPKEKWRVCTAAYAAAAVGLFMMFYPVLSGQTVNTQYVDIFLRWMKSWVL